MSTLDLLRKAEKCDVHNEKMTEAVTGPRAKSD